MHINLTEGLKSTLLPPVIKSYVNAEFGKNEKDNINEREIGSILFEWNEAIVLRVNLINLLSVRSEKNNCKGSWRPWEPVIHLCFCKIYIVKIWDKGSFGNKNRIL